jgi:hypothetical protein
MSHVWWKLEEVFHLDMPRTIRDSFSTAEERKRQ